MTETPIKLLLVDDEEDSRRSSAKWMTRKGHDVTDVSNAADALSLLERESFDVGIFDMNMPGMSGLELLQRIHQDKIDIEVIMLTGQGTVETAVSAMKMGACDFLSKPCALGDLEHHCFRARERHELKKENKQLKAVISRVRPAAKLIGESQSLLDVSNLIRKVAPTTKPVLIQGESGTGKEVVAQAIQQASRVADKPFVTVNCAALPENLVESELFGHQKGSFTGATAEKPGLFEIADGGTLFIDEIGELPPSLQPKLLRVLEDGSLRRVGCHRQRKVKVRIIAATNRDLQTEVDNGNFREDLFYRINVLSITLPPLREREGDIDRLIDHFLPRSYHIDDAAREALNAYPWPGNIRQLINVIERATILADEFDITPDDLPAEIVDYGQVPSKTTSEALPVGTPVVVPEPSHPRDMLGDTQYKLDDIARVHVLEVLEKEKGNKAGAARKLGIHRRKLYRLLDRFNGKADTESSDDESACESVL
ncbi:Alginate biosynthesis transcriptional regulatory protein AlgB [Rubripirellula tenax]|uniref:Alginate biosynthesis transcriptional regulatory protein AlgB n=1 Tax=Rubripirellula tenax TaxID=2528015 RepID=A0A5C6ELG6_9BACT|nr:sigma-54 dependent transcriptional regulator [Rubripirellula tenax]TWU50563.1 Alginate biosynthesis transcriptional regulatory protein AlgB [Rubripirellula tenax]